MYLFYCIYLFGLHLKLVHTSFCRHLTQLVTNQQVTVPVQCPSHFYL